MNSKFDVFNPYDAGFYFQELLFVYLP